MNGRLRRAWIREANRAGRRERVKFAEASSASLESGGRPCLEIENVSAPQKKQASRKAKQKQQSPTSANLPASTVGEDSKQAGQLRLWRHPSRTCEGTNGELFAK